MKLAGSRVLLTGATGGIGRVLAGALAAQGAQLVLSGRRADALEALCAELGAEMIAADLALASDVERLAEQAGRVDVLIANAALPASGHLLELSQAEIDVMLNVDLRAPIALVRALAPAMVARGHGHIAIVSSLAGKAATPASSIYSAAKFGLRGFAHSARADLRAGGVGVSVVLPGFVRDAGMFADTGVTLPRGVGTSSPAQVAAAVISAIEHNRAEVTVAPLAVRVGAGFAALAPSLAALGQRALGAGALARRVSAAQTDKRPPVG
jgi:short-subunit dehydrogenase